MKRTFFTLSLLIFLMCTLKAQVEFAPVGATWHYDVTYIGPDIDYHRIDCDSIVMIKGKACKRINIDYCACNTHFCQKLYTYQQQDTVFFFNPDIDTFQILYNFSAQAGDSWPIYTDFFQNSLPDTVMVWVDSTGTTIINDSTLKVLYVTYEYKDSGGWAFTNSSTVIEKLGDLEFLLNIGGPLSAVCDINFLHNLRCYEDDQIGFYDTGWRDSCDYTFRQKDTCLYVKQNPVWYFSPHSPTCQEKVITIERVGQQWIGDNLWSVLGLKEDGQLVAGSELTLFYHEPSKQVYFFEDGGKLLYDFNLEVGDTIQFYLPSNYGQYDISSTAGSLTPASSGPFRLTVDSVSQVLTDEGMPLNVRATHAIPNDDGECFYMGSIVSGIGSMSGLLGRPCAQLPIGCGEFFRCFETDDWNYSKIGIGECLVTSTEEVLSGSIELKLFPNPASEVLRIQTSHEFATLRILDLHGRVLSQQPFSPSLKVAHLPEGIYLLQLVDADGRFWVEKIVMQ